MPGLSGNTRQRWIDDLRIRLDSSHVEATSIGKLALSALYSFCVPGLPEQAPRLRPRRPCARGRRRPAHRA